MANDFLAHADAEAAARRATANGHNTEPIAHPIGDAAAGGRALAYANGALRSACEELATTPEGERNHTLNRSVFKLARFVTDGLLTEDEIADAFQYAATLAGLDSTEIRATIASGLEGRRKKPVTATIPPPPGDTTVTEVDPETLTGDEQQDLHQNAVARHAYELRIRDEGRALWTRQRAILMGQEPPHMVTMADFLAVEDEDIIYRVDDLFPVGARVLLAAQYKAGKTSLIANLLRCLVDGDQFLGRYDVAPIERVLLIDTELDERTLRRWLRDQAINNIDGINILSLRGRLASFAITDDQVRAEWANRIHGAQLIMLDCLRPCLDALGLSEDKEAGIFLTAFDALCRESGAGEAVVVHHMGHNSERSRGDSRLLDWPDALWKLVREQDDDGNGIDTGDRFFSALGRDVQVGESQLNWQPDTRVLTICGGNRIDKKAHGAVGDLIEILCDPAFADGLSKVQLEGKMKVYGHGRNVARAAIDAAVNDGTLYTVRGARKALLHHLNPSHKRD